jgi:2-iminobutanoate/2-iminopropanoate deaminase
MPKKVLTGESLPASSLPFSQLVEANGFVFVAGQVGDDPATGRRIEGDFEDEVRQMLENLGTLLRAAGLDYGDVVKATCYLTDFDLFPQMNAIYRHYFASEPPTRATVGVTRLAADYRVEIEVVATR